MCGPAGLRVCVCGGGGGGRTCGTGTAACLFYIYLQEWELSSLQNAPRGDKKQRRMISGILLLAAGLA